MSLNRPGQEGLTRVLHRWSRLGVVAAVLAAVTLSANAHAAADKVWTQDVEQALETAAKTDRDVLMDFTGSDWCPPCQKMDQEVFGTETFRAAATDDFVLVKLDFPRDRSNQSPETQQQNQAWAEKLKIEAFPTIVLLDSEGRPYAKAEGFQPGGPEAFLKTLEDHQSLRQRRDNYLSKASEASGLEKARLLDQALEPLDDQLVMGHYGGIVHQIVELDPKDKAGLRSKYERADFQMPELERLVQSGQFEQALPRVEAMLKDERVGDQQRQKLTVLKFAALAGSQQFEKAAKFAEQALGDTQLGPQAELQLALGRAGVLGQLGRHDEALEQTDAVLNSDRLPQQLALTVQMMKVNLLLEAGRLDEGRSLMGELVNNAPNEQLKQRMQMFFQQRLQQLAAQKKQAEPKSEAAPETPATQPAGE